MLTFHKICLVSTSLAGHQTSGANRALPLGDRTLIIAEISGRASASANEDLRAMAAEWSLDAGRDYIHPVVADLDGAIFAGYIDSISGTLTLQRERHTHPDRAMGYAICAAQIRSTSDRTFNQLPTRVIPFASDLAELLEAAVSACTVESQAPFHEAVAA